MKRIFLTILLYICTCACAVHAQKAESHNAQVARNLEIFNNIYKQLDLYYVDSLSADTTMLWAIKSMLAHVDPFTTYYPEDDEELRQMTTGKYAGIGSIIRWNKKEKRSMISEPFEGSPAQKAGLKAGDIILSIDGKDMKGKNNQEVSNLLRGDAGTTFELKVRRPNEKKPITHTITRHTIHTPNIPYYGMLNDTLGYIYLSSFTEAASINMRQALTELRAKGMSQLIFDLRDNPGGSMSEAVNIVNLFVPKGRKVLYTKGKVPSTNRDYYTTTEPIDTITPIVVMVDGGSASAAEIVSGSLQDMDRAVVIGARTYGKGLVQSVVEDNYRGSLKITISRYYIPSGRCIQAYDYRHLNADGSVGTVPDSLTNVFHTRNGREVRDGGGIKPDIEITPDSLPTFIYDLVGSDEFFDWVTAYCYSHNEIAPAGKITLTDEEYADFVSYIEKSGFTANRRTEEVLKWLKEAAKREGYYDDAQQEIEALEGKLKGDLGRDLERNRNQVLKYLYDELATRYYYQRGMVQQQLVGDKCTERAIEILSNINEYNKILGR